MFESFKARRVAAKATEAAASLARDEQAALAAWQSQRDELVSMLETARAPGVVPDGLVVHRGEESFGTLTSCSLIEERKGPGHFVAGSTGVSIPIGTLGGRSVRYRVGATRGHYVQGTPSPTAIATGTLFLTNQRFCFLSATQTRECRLDKLVGLTRDDAQGLLTLSISNRQHPIVISYGAAVAGWVGFHVDLALAQWRGDVVELTAKLQRQLDELDATSPAAPGGATPVAEPIPGIPD